MTVSLSISVDGGEVGRTAPYVLRQPGGGGRARLPFPATLIWPRQSSCLVLKVSCCYEAPWHYLGATDERIC